MHQWCISFTEFGMALKVQRPSCLMISLPSTYSLGIATSLMAYHEFPLQENFTSVVPNWRTIITNKFTYCCKHSWPHIRFPNLGISQRDLESQGNLTLKDSGILLQNFHRTEGKRHKTDGSWWRVLTKCGPLEKGMAKHFSIFASSTL